MDRESRYFSNDSVLNDPMLGQCRHGKRWDMCGIGDCREIWQLFQKQRKDHQRDEKDWQNAEFVEKRRKRGMKSQYEIALEQRQKERVVSSDDDGIHDAHGDQPDAIRAGAKKVLRNSFPDGITIQAAIQFKVVTLRQGQVLKEYFNSDEALPISKRCDAIGKKIGFSGKTVEREFRILVGKFLKNRNDETAIGERPNIKAVHVRGERGVHFYKLHSLRFGQWKREMAELITDRATIRELREKREPVIFSTATPVPLSSMNRLFAALIRVFADDIPDRDRCAPEGVGTSDWEYDLLRAQRILGAKKNHSGPWTGLEVARVFARGSRQCEACRTHLIRGFRINGRQITRARRFCDDACKMAAERRKSRLRSEARPTARL